ncbi:MULTISPECIES: exonuclease SbcCD subunit D [Anaerolinea]|uniref:metallophosphoesterase family protein n=1 Tax=Anaerolinea TaxID=233189 RepID=UPI0026292394|nr:exonuclease SbcCD subunit D [Anaerolinea thermophila]
MKILHFSDAHIDIISQGKLDSKSGLPIRTLDFLKALDQIVDAAIAERVDLVLFTGDAYKDRTPVPTYQREWGKRMRRLSEAGILTLMITGNHDISPSQSRAHALQEYETLGVPHVYVCSKPSFLTPKDLEGLPLQVVALPWVPKTGFLSIQESNLPDIDTVNQKLEEVITQLIHYWLENRLDPNLPAVLAAHASVEGAQYSSERSIMLGNDVTLSRGLVCDPRWSYVALGHIHKAQNLNEGNHPPVIYAGSIERVNFGEAREEKFFVLIHLDGNRVSQVEWRKLQGRRFIDRSVSVSKREGFMETILEKFPSPEEIEGSVFRLTVDYPAEYEKLLDEALLRRRAEGALEFLLVRRPQREVRLRLPEGALASDMSPLELLEMYLKSINVASDEIPAIKSLAQEILWGGESEEN